MRSSFDYYRQIEKPNMYLCNPDQTPICTILGENRHIALRFNDLSELTFTVSEIENVENSYNLLETKRLVFVEGIGWFQITNVSETIDGERKSKDVTAESHQTALKSKGFITEERVYIQQRLAAVFRFGYYGRRRVMPDGRKWRKTPVIRRFFLLRRRLLYRQSKQRSHR